MSDVPAILIVFLVSTIVFALGVLLLATGTWGTRARDRFTCRRCDYDLRGFVRRPDRCPECGSDLWGADAIRVRRRRTDGRLIRVGAMVSIVGLTPFAVAIASHCAHVLWPGPAKAAAGATAAQAAGPQRTAEGWLVRAPRRSVASPVETPEDEADVTPDDVAMWTTLPGALPGLGMSSDPVDPEWTVLHRLSERPRAGAVVAGSRAAGSPAKPATTTTTATATRSTHDPLLRGEYAGAPSVFPSTWPGLETLSFESLGSFGSISSLAPAGTSPTIIGRGLNAEAGPLAPVMLGSPLAAERIGPESSLTTRIGPARPWRQR